MKEHFEQSGGNVSLFLPGLSSVLCYSAHEKRKMISNYFQSPTYHKTLYLAGHGNRGVRLKNLAPYLRLSGVSSLGERQSGALGERQLGDIISMQMVMD